MAHMILAAAYVNATASPFFWYLTRTLAVGAYVTLTLAVMLGLLQSIARTTGEHLSWIVADMHTFVSVLTGVLVAGHLFTLLVDPFLPFNLSNIFILGNQPYKPLAVNVGVLAFYAMIALLLSSYLRARISYGLWRTIHYISFVAFVLVTFHGWMGGSDAVTNWAPPLYVGCSVAVGYLLFVRMFAEEQPRSAAARPASLMQSKAGRSVMIALFIAVIGAGVTLAIENSQTSSGQIQHTIPSGQIQHNLRRSIATPDHLPA